MAVMKSITDTVRVRSSGSAGRNRPAAFTKG
jgi:hypothetical protein